MAGMSFLSTLQFKISGHSHKSIRTKLYGNGNKSTTAFISTSISPPYLKSCTECIFFLICS